MTAQPFLIANMRVGVERDMEPWLLPEDAFPNLEDCYLFRGRIQRRRGYTQLGRLVTGIGMAATFNNLPVMGLRTRELTAINEEQLIGFDTRKANSFSNSSSSFIDISFNLPGNAAPFSWTGTNSDFFWTENYLSAFWATNNILGFQNNPVATNPALGDGIRFYDGIQWFNFLPQVDGANFLMGSLLIIAYRNRLVMLNTTEGSAFGISTIFRQRARWSQNGTPYYVAGAVPAGQDPAFFQANAWRSDVAGKGGFIDAPTSEEIISAQFFKDTLIVFFERSTWQLRYTGNELLPFIWERINVELGVESTFSMIPFDAGIIGVGNYGIMTCDSTGVKRIDQIIPDEVFNIHNGNDGVKRVYGIRDFTQQLVYWTFPSADQNPIFPNRVLIYNYLDGSYAFFNDSLTCFGTFQPFADTTWANLPQQWQETPDLWNSGQFQSDYPLIVAGNQQGFVFTNINRGPIINDFSLTITGATNANPGVITSVNHNLIEGTIIIIDQVVGMTQLNGNIYRVSKPITANTFIIQTLDINGNFINVDTTTFGVYGSGGFIKVKNNFIIETKRFNPFLKQGDQMRLQNVDFFVETDDDLAFTCRVFLDENDDTTIEQDAVVPQSNFSSKVWIRTYFSVIGQFAQLELTFDDEQMFDPAISNADVTIHAMMLWMSNGGRLTYGSIF